MLERKVELSVNTGQGLGGCSESDSVATGLFPNFGRPVARAAHLQVAWVAQLWPFLGLKGLILRRWA